MCRIGLQSLERDVIPVSEGMSGGQWMAFMIVLKYTINLAKFQCKWKEKR